MRVRVTQTGNDIPVFEGEGSLNVSNFCVLATPSQARVAIREDVGFIRVPMDGFVPREWVVGFGMVFETSQVGPKINISAGKEGTGYTIETII